MRRACQAGRGRRAHSSRVPGDRQVSFKWGLGRGSARAPSTSALWTPSIGQVSAPMRKSIGSLPGMRVGESVASIAGRWPRGRYS